MMKSAEATRNIPFRFIGSLLHPSNKNEKKAVHIAIPREIS